MLILNRVLFLCLLQCGTGSHHHSKGQQSLHIQHGGQRTLFYIGIMNHVCYFTQIKCRLVSSRLGYWWLVKTSTPTGSGKFVVPSLRLSPDEQEVWRYSHSEESRYKKRFLLFLQHLLRCHVHRYSWSRSFRTRRRSRWSTAWQQSGGGWGSFMLRSSQTFSAAVQPNWVRVMDQALKTQMDTCIPSRELFCFCTTARRMSGVSGRCSCWTHVCGECGAGAPTSCQPPGQHLRGADNGLDGECGHNFSKVWCLNSSMFSLVFAKTKTAGAKAEMHNFFFSCHDPVACVMHIQRWGA